MVQDGQARGSGLIHTQGTEIVVHCGLELLNCEGVGSFRSEVMPHSTV